MNRLNTVMNKNVIYLLTARYHERFIFRIQKSNVCIIIWLIETLINLLN